MAVQMARQMSLEFVESEWGTFKESLKAPVHRWFQFPAGFSYRLVEERIREARLGGEDLVLDPFVGCGTVPVVAKLMGVPSVGIDAHPFVLWVARVKTFWEFEEGQPERAVREIAEAIREGGWREEDISDFPPLVRKCFSEENLKKLKFLRERISRLSCPDEVRDFLNLALASTLRVASKAGTGWPYIAPAPLHQRAREREAFSAFLEQVGLMLEDLRIVRERCPKPPPRTRLVLGDARRPYPDVEPESVSLLLTSPPYLNNYDYADRTRLEMFFFGQASSWRDITEKVRRKLLVACTTQVRRGEFDEENPVRSEIWEADSELASEILGKVRRLAEIRRFKGGRKSYDLMVAGYFNDMFDCLRQIYRVMKRAAESIWVLGDSAPYGVYIPTEEYLGRMACAIGFRGYKVQVLRRRGGKWAHNPQRHKVPLKECILTIVK